MLKPLDEHDLLQQLQQIMFIQRLEHIDPGPGQQRTVQFKRRVFRGGTNKNHGAILDIGQECILLRLVEAVNLIHEQHRLATEALLLLCLINRGPDFLHSAEDGGNTQELSVNVIGKDHCQRGFTHAGRSPQDHGMNMAGFNGTAQRLIFPEQMPLARVSLQRSGTHPGRQRLPLIVAVEEIRHDAYCSSITSTEDGRFSANRVSASFWFSLMSLNWMRVV